MRTLFHFLILITVLFPFKASAAEVDEKSAVAVPPFAVPDLGVVTIKDIAAFGNLRKEICRATFLEKSPEMMITEKMTQLLEHFFTNHLRLKGTYANNFNSIANLADYILANHQSMRGISKKEQSQKIANGEEKGKRGLEAWGRILELEVTEKNTNKVAQTIIDEFITNYFKPKLEAAQNYIQQFPPQCEPLRRIFTNGCVDKQSYRCEENTESFAGQVKWFLNYFAQQNNGKVDIVIGCSASPTHDDLLNSLFGYPREVSSGCQDALQHARAFTVVDSLNGWVQNACMINFDAAKVDTWQTVKQALDELNKARQKPLEIHIYDHTHAQVLSTPGVMDVLLSITSQEHIVTQVTQ